MESKENFNLQQIHNALISVSKNTNTFLNEEVKIYER